MIDASGSSGALLDSIPQEDWTHKLRTNSSAIFSHFNHVKSLNRWLLQNDVRIDDYPFIAEDAAVHHLFDDGWLWRLRFESGVTSVGFVFDDRTAAYRSGHIRTWDDLLNHHSQLRSILGEATLANFPGRVYRTQRLQRLRSIAAGDDWAALPFTTGFVDPMHSTGIAHSISGIMRLSKILLNEHRREQELFDYSLSIINEIRRIDQLIAGCYASLNDFELFKASCMVYFAIATNFELNFPDAFDSNSTIPLTGFLGLGDEKVGSMIDQYSLAMENPTQETVDAIEQIIEPINHVGLFHPAKKNLYARTASKA